jgi:Asp-tRNA(Asn)/Glu-tRNA(Gln) amidotransferase A subunit family amidase
VNEYFGTPRNPFNRIRKRIPGGSSSGSAVAVANEYADVAFGTDTAGSIRVPAACCGVVGLKTTHGLVPIEGVHPIEADHLDTVGPMAADIEHTVLGMDLLENGFAAKYSAAKAAKPTAQQIRVGRLKLNGTDRQIDEAVDRALAKAGFQVVTLDDEFRNKWDQAKRDGNTVAAAGAWISNRRYQFSPRVAGRTKTAILAGRIVYPGAYRRALARRVQWQHALAQVFKQVDYIVVPTLQRPPPVIPPNLGIGLLEGTVLNLQNTVPVNLAGNPALAVPIPVHAEGFPVTSLQLIGPRMSEAELLNAGRLVEAAVKHEHFRWLHLWP